MSGPWIAGFVALWIATILLGTLVIGLLRRVNNVLETAERRVASASGGPGIGGAAPGTTIGAFEADLGGITVSSHDLFPGVFLFLSTPCALCLELAPQLGSFGREVDDVPVYVVLEDTPEGREFPVPPEVPVLYQRKRAVSDAFETHATPQAFAVDAKGTVVEQAVPSTTTKLRELAARSKAPAGGDGAASVAV
jgi:hypothetical protein